MSVLDEKKKTLCPEVWDIKQSPPVMQPLAKKDIIDRLSTLTKDLSVEAVFIVGSLTGFRYTPDSDLDVSVTIDLDDAALEELRDETKGIEGELLAGTKHPVNFYFLNEVGKLDNYDSVYDFVEDKWIKEPSDIGVDLFDVYDEFRGAMTQLDDNKAEALRSITDIETLRAAYNNGGDPAILRYKLMRRYKDLDAAVEALVAEYDEAHQDRLRAFKRYTDLAAIGVQALPSPNVLPENIRYKMLERYHYLDLLKKLQDITGDEGKLDTPDKREEAREVLEEETQKSLLDSFAALSILTK
jgi:predicted nucleotidyltransferase